MTLADDQTNVRLPRILKDWLREQAAKNRRSLTSEIVTRLEESREAKPKAQKVKPQ